ncbi:MAG: hypothetical protein ABJH68_15395 [Ilumatobacter sp.]|uniref:hypothetical protein n=1 Tax=Ilumatobacter sp. TaxID=1967498 RepID=UPI0032974AF9
MHEPTAARSFDTKGWLWQRVRRFVWGIGIVAALLLFSAIAIQFDGNDEPERVTTPLVTIRPVDAPTRSDVADALYGTATCIDDPSCAIVTGVTAGAGGTLVIETSMYPDGDAVIPAGTVRSAV